MMIAGVRKEQCEQMNAGYFIDRLWCRRLLWSAMVWGCMVASAVAQQSVKGLQRFPLLQPGVVVSGELDVSRGGPVEQRYRLHLPEDVVVLHAEILLADADLDLALYRTNGERIALAEERAALETLTLRRHDVTSLEGGQYFLDVLYQYNEAPTGRTVLPFELVVHLIDTAPRQTLTLGKPHYDRLEQKAGMLHYYRVDVPDNATALRIDVFDTPSDLDLFLFAGEASPDIFTSTHYAASLRPSERLLVTANSQPPLQPGTPYHLVVVDQVEYLRDVTYAVHVDVSSAPPDFLAYRHEIPVPHDDLERALLATVEVMTWRSSGSGTLISSYGHVLTNYHVIDGYQADDSEIVIGLSLDHRLPTQEMFHAAVLAVAPERDMALLRLVEGVYGEAVASFFPLPYLTLRADDPRIGDDLTVIGYPTVGGRWARGTISLTRGYVSGFEADDFGTVIKTDTEFSQGNSGGSALDSRFNLVGIPTQTVGQGYGKLGYIYPVSALPTEWLNWLSTP